MDDELLQIAYMEEKADFEEYGHMENEEEQNDENVEFTEIGKQKRRNKEVTDSSIMLLNILN